MIFDSHCHYNLEPLFSEVGGWKSYWQTAQDHGIRSAVVVGTNHETSQRADSIAQQDPQLYATLGIHPSEYQEKFEEYATDPSSIEAEIFSLAQLKSHKVVAIGETGLDYFRLPADTTQALQIKELQKKGFTAQIQLADELDLPLIIHVRDTDEEAYFQVLSLLEQHKHRTRPFILHCISGPMSYIQAAVKMGAYFGVAGNVTYINAEHIRNLVKVIPPERLLLETDAPFLPPREFRGKTCEPWMICKTAEALEQQLAIPSDILYQNTLKVFSL